MPPLLRLGSVLTALLLSTGCTGTIADPGVSGDSPPRAQQPTTYIPGVGCSGIDVPSSPFVHLTRAQYDNTVRDLLGIAQRRAEGFAPDDASEGLEVGTGMSPLLAEQYFETAAELAAEAVADPAALHSCAAASLDDACAATLIDDVVGRAFRRPLTADEHERFMTLFRAGQTEYDDATGLEMVLHAALTSPFFVYHVEPVPPDARPGDVVPVTGYAMASRLSYFLWNTMPDEALFEAAASGELDTAEGVAAQAQRMLGEDRAREGIENFYRQWLHLDRLDGLTKDPAFYPDFNESVARDMRASLDAYFAHVVFEGDGSVASLFDNSTVFLNENLATALGVDGVAGNELQPVPLDPTERSGILTQPGMMALLGKGNQSDPIHRGVFVRTELLCQHLPPPPADLVIVPPDPEPGISTRERFSEHTANPACAECHTLIDPIGFGLENYDGMGRFRLEDEGTPVDASGELTYTSDADGPFDGAAELSARLARSSEVRQCVARKLFRYSVGRTEQDAERCQLEHVYEIAEDAGWSIPQILQELTQTNSFRHRRVEEVTP
jgi:hypothetical protein